MGKAAIIGGGHKVPAIKRPRIGRKWHISSRLRPIRGLFLSERVHAQSPANFVMPWFDIVMLFEQVAVR